MRLRNACLLVLFIATGFGAVFTAASSAQEPAGTKKPDDVIRITTELVQTDIVVLDKKDQPVSDLKIADFELFENGKKQDLQFIEFISIGRALPRQNTYANPKRETVSPATAIPSELTPKELKRVLAFVIDDVTIPPQNFGRVKEILTDYVDRKMVEGDLVAIVRTTDDNPFLEQFTSDKQILRRAIAALGPRSVSPGVAYPGLDPARVTKIPGLRGNPDTSEQIGSQTIDTGTLREAADAGANQVPRALQAFRITNAVVDSLARLSGRKNLVLLSGGLPVFDTNDKGEIAGDVNEFFRRVTDNATRTGVVINTMDVRGLTTAGAVSSFNDTPAKSAIGGGTLAGMDGSATFGRAGDKLLLGDKPSGEQVTLRALASLTGGVSVVDSNNFTGGMEDILKRSQAYYRLAYKSTEKFDNKFHKLEVKVKRAGVRVYGAEGYFAREDKSGNATKEDKLVAAAASPLAKRDLDVTAELQYQFNPDNKAQLDINAFINASKLSFKKTPDGKYHTTFDVVGFVFDQLGNSKGGMSQTVNVALTEDNYRRALMHGLSYSANTQLPPGYYQVRLVIRETETGKIGTVSRYFEVPDLTNKQLNMSSILLYGVKPGADAANPEQLPASRVISRQQELRYAAIVYNAKAEGGKTHGKSQLIISQGNKVLFKEPEQALVTAGRGPGEYVRIGQIGLAQVPPGNYVLTLIVTDPLADKDKQTVSREINFTVVD